jgi:hypothetical protein
MNQLKVHQQETIAALFQQGWSKRKIARELALDRATVRKYLAGAISKSPTPLTGSTRPEDSKSPTPQTGSAPEAESKSPPPPAPRVGQRGRAGQFV